MSLTMNHDTRYLQSLRCDELSRYIDGCMTKAYAEARNHYREELQEGLEVQARNQEQSGAPLRVPLPVKAAVCIGEAWSNATAERMTWVEFTPDQIRAFSHFLTGVRP
jgi:hypothetical protein